jgi:polyhydroxyalkanoate synthesis regulator phasin
MDADTVEEIKRHFGIVAEDLRSEIRAVAEGQELLREQLTSKIDGLEREIHSEFEEAKAMIRFSYAELDRRIHTLETEVSDLRVRLERLEALAGS